MSTFFYFVNNSMGDTMSIYLQLIIASILWGTNVILMKIFLTSIPFLLLATMRVCLSLFFIVIYMKIKRITFQYQYKRKAMIIGIFGIYLNFYFTFLGMNQIKGIDSALLNALAPAFTFLLSLMILKKKGSSKEYFALGISCFAFLLSIHFRLFSIGLGFIYLFIGMILYMLSNVYVQKWDLHHSFALLFYEFLSGFIFLFAHTCIQGQLYFEGLYNISFIYWILFFVISGMGFAYIQIVYFQSIEQIGVFKTSFYLSLNPIVTYLESLIFLKEQFDWIHFLSFILLGFSIFLIKRKST